MINKLLEAYEITNRVNLDEKTFMQKKIEIILTNGRGYEKVQCVRFLGEKIALRTWLKCSKTRLLYSQNYEEQHTLLERNVAIISEYISSMQQMSEKSFF